LVEVGLFCCFCFWFALPFFFLAISPRPAPRDASLPFSFLLPGPADAVRGARR
jgi:hypothetical protein